MTRSQKTFFSLVFVSFISLAVLATGQPARADETLLVGQEGYAEIGGVFGGQPEDIRIIVAKVIVVVLGFLGVIFIGLTVFAGFEYMTAAGNEEKTKKAVGLLKSAIIGLIIVLAAWSITRFSILIMGRTLNNSVDYTRYTN